jgi:hypothetical protein
MSNLTLTQFVKSFYAAAGEYPRAGDFYYHRECCESGAPCSVYETERGYLAIPTDGSEPSVYPNDIRGMDRPGPVWYDLRCPNCGADSILRDPQEGEIQYPETWEAPVGCSCCGWEGRALGAFAPAP